MLSEGVRDVTKLRWLRDNYPEFAEELDAALAGINSGSAATIHTAQQAVNDVARRVAKTIDPGTAPETTPGGERTDKDKKPGSGLSPPAKIGIAAGVAGAVAVAAAAVAVGIKRKKKK